MDLSSPTGRESGLQARSREDGSAPRVLVMGATGYLGGRLVPRLLAAGYRVRVLVRNPDRLAAFAWGEDVDTVVGDAREADAVASAMTDIDIVYYLIHSMTSGRRFADLDRRVAEVTARSAHAAGVRRIIYLGGLHPTDVPLSDHLRSRVEVGDILLASGVPTAVLQAGVVIGSGSASFEMIRHLTEVLPYMPAPKWVRNYVQPIAVRDVLYYLLAAAHLPPEVNRSVDIGGPDIWRYGQMMNGYALAAGLPQRGIAALPVLTPRLASRWVHLVTPIPRSLAGPLIESLQNNCVVADDRAVGSLIPPPPGGLTPYRQAVALALGRVETDAVETSWLDATVPEAPSDPLPSDPEWAGRTVFTDDRTRDTSATVAALWSVIAGIGGENGWYSTPVLWSLRGWGDRLLGGVGLSRGRRSRTRVAVGDAIDFWRVEACEEGSVLRLRAEMKVPGSAWLELRCEPRGTGSRYRQRAVFFPKGLAGRLYWWAIVPFHGIIFAGMLNLIVSIAEDGRPESA